MKTAWLALTYYAGEVYDALRKACTGECLMIVACAVGFAALVWVGVQ